MDNLPMEFQLNDISLFESLAIAFYEALFFLKLLNWLLYYIDILL